ncbi:MAG: PEP-CTERM/exosortase A-associated glycosyltransferase [Alphaproteobacteria bacterium]|jgi:PEP-CTERM/exosortase A-associated glycosyltransferase
MRILHIYDHTEPLQSGYVFRSRSLRMALDKAGNQCDILSMPRHYANNDKTIYKSATEVIDNITYHRSPPTQTRIPILRELCDIKNAYKYIRFLMTQHDYDYDYIHIHSPFIGVIAALLARFLSGLKDIKIVYEIRAFWEDAAVDHGTLKENSVKYKIIHTLETWVCKKVDHIYPICQPLKDDLIKRGIASDKMTIIPNVLTENAFNAHHTENKANIMSDLKARLGITDADYVLGFIGSFYAYEGLEDLMPIMKRFKDTNKKVKLLLVGGGTIMPLLRRYIENHHLQDTVILTGRVPHNDVALYYDVCRAMIYPRRSMRLTETVTPLKPLEAAAAKVPVILSNIGGHRELLIDQETGFFINNFQDTLNSAEHIYNILSNKLSLDKVSMSAFNYVTKHHKADYIIKKYYRF